ncbi:50S ribosomal protein L29 [Patescibacteria group bacterium]|nr:50S ribosomal protein L29 [Patescibacteria group bacterium]MBP9710164.1 50S ribosomal protein L29 [Patescibacteria group bacterium]
MDISTLRTASAAERERLLIEARTKLRDLRFKVATRQLTKVRQIRVLKRDIAQILTVIAH